MCEEMIYSAVYMFLTHFKKYDLSMLQFVQRYSTTSAPLGFPAGCWPSYCQQSGCRDETPPVLMWRFIGKRGDWARHSQAMSGALMLLLSDLQGCWSPKPRQCHVQGRQVTARLLLPTRTLGLSFPHCSPFPVASSTAPAADC